MSDRSDFPSGKTIWPIIDRLPISIYMKDVDCKFTYMNYYGAKKHGLDHPADIKGKTDEDFFDASQAKEWIAEEKKIIASMKEMIDQKELEFWKDGRRRWVLTSKFPLLAPDGTLLGLFGMTRDITKLERINLAGAGAREGLWYRALKSDEVWYSPHWKEILGYADDELPNRRETFKKLVHTKDWPLVEKEINAHINYGAKHYECTFRMRHKDGTYRWIHSRGMVTRDEHSEPLILAGSHADVTDSFDRESFYLKVLDTIPSLIFVKDSDLRFVFVNEAVAENFDTSKSKIIGKKDADINPEREQVDFFIKADTDVIAKQKAIDIPEEILTDAHGNRRILTTRKMPLFYPGKKGVHVLGIATDITDLKKVREDLKKILDVLTNAVKDIENSESEDDACALVLLHLENLGCKSVMLSFLREQNGGRVVVTDSQYATGKFTKVAGQIQQLYGSPESKRDLLPIVLAEKRSRFIPDSSVDPECDSVLYKKSNIISQYIVPIATDSLMIGTLQIDLGSLKEKPKTECEMFDALGAHLSLAIERHRVLHRLETINNDLINQARMIAFQAAAAKIIHELNRSISDYSKLLRQKMNHVEIRKNKAAVDFLKFTTKQIAQWIESVQDNIYIVRKNEEEGDYNVEDIVKEVISYFQQKASAQHRILKGIYEAPNATASIRRGSLLELLSCLIVNSFEADARQVEVIVRKMEKFERSETGETNVEIVVSDDGHGIPEDYNSQIYSFGWSSKGKRGHGMGLPIIRLLARAMEGDVFLKSRGKSAGQPKTEFIVRIPVDNI